LKTHIKDSKSMSAGANPYKIEWKDLDEYLQDMIVGHAHRRIEWTESEYRELPEELVPMDILQAFKEEYGDAPINLDCDLTFVFERSKHGILGPVTAHFSNCIVTDGDRAPSYIPEDLDLDDVAAQMDYKFTYSGITKIRLLERPAEPIVAAPSAHSSLVPMPTAGGGAAAAMTDVEWRSCLFELTQKKPDGNKEVILVSPEFSLNLHSHTMFVQQMQEKLHMKHRVVAGVFER